MPSDSDVPGPEERFRLLVDEVEEYAIFMLDPDGHVVTWNEGAELIKGYTKDEILGTHFSAFYPPSDVEAGKPETGLKVAAREGQWVDEGWRLRKDGSRFWARVTITALHDENGQLRGFGKVTRDMTERRQQEVELQQQKQRAQEAEQRAKRENALLRLMQTVAATANDADSLESAVTQALNIVCDHLDWPVGHVYWVSEEDPPRLKSSQIWSLDAPDRFDAFRTITEASDFALGESLPGRAAEYGEPIWIPDVTEDPRFIRSKRITGLGVKGAFAFPLCLDDAPLAVLEFFSTEKEESDAALLDAMDSVGVQLSRVAERERAQAELRRSERHYRQLFETSQEGIVIQAPNRRITDLNPAALDILGYKREALIGREPTALFADPSQRQKARRRLKTQGELRNLELNVRHADGDVIVCEATTTLQRDSDGNPEAFYTIFRDITERKRVQKALKESEEKYRRLFEESRDAILLTTPEGEIVDANSATEEIFGYSREELLNLNAADLYANPEERTRRIVPSLEGPRSTHLLEAEMCHADGHTFLASASVTKHQNVHGHPELIQALVRDITEQRELEAKLLQIQDEERQRLGRELHDGVGSLLTSAAILTSSLAGQLKKGKPVDPEDLNDATEHIQEAADQARAISHGLQPVGLERGLLTALEELVSQTEVRADLSCSLDVSGPVPDLSEQTATHIYRITQEAINNGLKHADAEHIQVHLRADDEGTITLTVQDDGQGYSPSSNDEGMGMRTMRYRANLLNGSLSIEKMSEGGTRVQCIVPAPNAL